jgi:hypothetical protein
LPPKGFSSVGSLVVVAGWDVEVVVAGALVVTAVVVGGAVDVGADAVVGGCEVDVSEAMSSSSVLEHPARRTIAAALRTVALPRRRVHVMSHLQIGFQPSTL